MKKKITVLTILIILLMLCLITTVYAWFSESLASNSFELNSGEIKVEVNGSLIDSDETNYILPGQNLVLTNYTLTNSSSIDIELRIKIEYSYVNKNETNETELLTKTYQGLENEELIVSLDSKWVNNQDYWYYGEIITDETNVLHSEQIKPTTTELPLIDDIHYNGEVVGNDYSYINLNQELSIKLTFEVKQAKHLTWQLLGEYQLG